MELNQLTDRLKPFVQRNIIPLSLGFLGIAFLLYGLISLISIRGSSDPITFKSGGGVVASESAKIVVDIEGAVVNPGVYKVGADSRLQDGLIAAGGLSQSADREWITKNLNLAAKLSDGVKVYIPKEGESVMGTTSSTSTMGITGNTLGVSQNASGLININTASESELDVLPGIGPVTAQKIINGRPYGSVEELLNKKIVSSKVYGQIKEKVTVN